MSITFPTSPVTNQTFTSGSRSWKWNGFAWDAVLDIPAGGGSGITADPYDLVSRNLSSDYFDPVKTIDRTGSGRKVLVLNEDGSFDFEFIRFQDVFRNSDFLLTVENFRLNGKKTNIDLIGSGDYDLSDLGNSTFTVEYPSEFEDTISAAISSNSFVGDTTIDLVDPFTSLNVSSRSVSYPAASDGSVTFTINAVGSQGTTDSDTCSIVFPNYIFYGVTGSSGVDGSNLAENGFNEVLKTGSNLSSGVSITLNWSDPIQKGWFAYPSKHGLLTSIADTDTNQDQFGSWDLISEVPFTNSNNYVEDFYIYRSTESGSGTQNLTFKT